MSAAVRAGYKQTEVGVIPEDWNARKLAELASFRTGPFGSALHKSDYTNDGVPVVNPMHINDGRIEPTRTMTITESAAAALSDFRLTTGEVIIGRRGDMGRCAVVREEQGGWLCGTGSMIVRPVANVDAHFLQRVLSSATVISAIENSSVGSTMINLNQGTLGGLMIQAPPLPEQRAIAAALGDVDALLAKLDEFFVKKRDLKQATMQQLLTGQTRMPGFCGKWEVKRLGDITECLDNVRVPLNESQRNRMRGDFPYCGANGVLDFVNDYVLDDDVILMAEDGGYFDEYAYRPIAYRMVGKFWVNNHAHILKAKAGYNQSLLFYLLVHKNIQSFLASGTRAKLNKSEMNKIEVNLSLAISEQAAIAAILSDMDAELTALEARRDKTRALKQGMMQELLTGRIRLVSPTGHQDATLLDVMVAIPGGKGTGFEAPRLEIEIRAAGFDESVGARRA